MNFDEFSQAPCIVARRPTGCTVTDSRCSDLEFGADHPDVCPGAPTITGLQVVPDTAEVPIGGRVPYRAFLLFSNGQRKDVTGKSTWATSDEAIARVLSTGIVTGEAVGTTTIQASYRELFDFAQLTVIAVCVQAGMDLVIVLDRSAGMGDTGEDWTQNGDKRTLLQAVKESVLGLVQNANFPKDRIAVVSCAGTYDESGELHPYHPSATLHLGLSPVEQDVEAAIDSVQMGNCYSTNSQGQHLSECATGLGAGLQKAQAELQSVRSRPEARKVVVLVSLGWEVYCSPDPVAIAAQMRDQNYTVMGVVVIPSINYTPACGAPPAEMSNWAFVEQMVTCGLFYGANKTDELPAIFAISLANVCAKKDDPCLYYIPPTAGTPPVKTCYRDQLDYFGWINWNVVQGYVDLVGLDLYPLQPGHGMYMDLVGTFIDRTDPSHPIVPVGAIETKQEFTFPAGRYRLSMEISGNLRQELGGYKIQITIGTLFDVIVQIDDWKQPFTLYSWDFSAPSASAARLLIKHLPIPKGGIATVGTMIDDVKLENLDTGLVMLNDTFDEENPCPS